MDPVNKETEVFQPFETQIIETLSKNYIYSPKN